MDMPAPDQCCQADLDEMEAISGHGWRCCSSCPDTIQARHSSGSSSRSARCPSCSRGPRWMVGHLLTERYEMVSKLFSPQHQQDEHTLTTHGAFALTSIGRDPIADAVL